MDSRAHHVPGREGSCHQTKEREGTVVLEGGEKHCQQRHKSPHDGPCPESARTVCQAMTCDCSMVFVQSPVTVAKAAEYYVTQVNSKT